MDYSQKDNLLIQSYFATSFLAELNSNDFLKSEYYKNLTFQDKFVKDNMPSIGIDNQGTLLLFLYTMLVIPKQLIENEFLDEFSNLNNVIEKVKTNAESNYKKDAEKIDYIRHIRNSVAHARVDFEPKKTVTFIAILTSKNCYYFFSLLSKDLNIKFKPLIIQIREKVPNDIHCQFSA